MKVRPNQILIPILILALLNSSNNLAQNSQINRNKEVQDFLAKGKKAVIQSALKLIDENIAPEHFTDIKIMTNGTDILVLFLNPIKYLPINSIYYFDVSVLLIEKVVWKESVANPEGHSQKTIPFYQPTKDAEGTIQFVLQSIKDSEIIDAAGFNGEIIIREHNDYYATTVISESQESLFKTDKISGESYDKRHNHLEPPPNEVETENPYEEVLFPN